MDRKRLDEVFDFIEQVRVERCENVGGFEVEGDNDPLRLEKIKLKVFTELFHPICAHANHFLTFSQLIDRLEKMQSTRRWYWDCLWECDLFLLFIKELISNETFDKRRDLNGEQKDRASFLVGYIKGEASCRWLDRQFQSLIIEVFGYIKFSGGGGRIRNDEIEFHERVWLFVKVKQKRESWTKERAYEELAKMGIGNANKIFYKYDSSRLSKGVSKLRLRMYLSGEFPNQWLWINARSKKEFTSG